MKKASWIVLAVAGAAFILISLVSASHAYNRGDDYGIGGMRVSKVAAGRETVATALRGIRRLTSSGSGGPESSTSPAEICRVQ